MSGDKKSFVLKIYARERPFTTKSEAKKTNTLTIVDSHDIVMKCGYNQKKFTFDHIFDENSKQEDVYDTAVAPMVANMIAGFNCTVLAYGPTGSGKSYTMFGPLGDDGVDFSRVEDKGMIPQVAFHLFSELIKLNPKIEYTVRVSFINIYNECVHDLLNEGTSLRMYDDPLSKGSVFMRDIFKVTVLNSSDVCDWLNIGLSQLFKSSTDPNQRNRTHTIFTFSIDLRDVSNKGEEIIKSGKLQLIDLAGSENITRVGNSDIRGREGVNINRSIITLHKVIKALFQKMQYIPYRDSKLTRMLQDSLGGNTKTAIIATFVPNATVLDETINTLELTQIAKTIVNYPVININKKQASFFNEMKSEILKLKEELAAARSGEGFYISSETYNQMIEDEETNNKKIVKLIQDIQDMEDTSAVMKNKEKELIKSFEQTKAYLETVKLQLQVKENEVTEAEKVVYDLTKKRDKLSKTAHALLHTCEVATKNEDIYHQKYQDKCNANQNNISTSAEMVEVAASAMDNCSKIIDDNVTFRNNNFEEILEFSNSIAKRNDNIIKAVNTSSSTITEEFQNLYLIKHKALGANNPENCINYIFNGISEIYKKSLSHEKDKTKLIDELLNSKENLDSSITNLFQKFTVFVKDIKKSIVSTTSTVDECTNFLDDLNRNLIIQEHELNDKLSKTDKELFDINMQIQKNAEEERHLISLIKSLEEKYVFLTKLKKAYEGNKLNEDDRITGVIADVQNLNDIFVAQKTLIDGVIHTLTRNEAATFMKSRSCEDDVEEFINAMLCRIKTYLTSTLKQHRTSLSSWESSINDFICNLPNIENDKIIALINCLDTAQKSLNIQNMEIDKIIADTKEKYKHLNSNICNTGHIGDTPVKQTYKYPQKIDESFDESVENDNEIEEMKTDENN